MSKQVYSESSMCSHLRGLVPLRFCAWSLQGEGAESDTGKTVSLKQGLKKPRYIAG